MNVLVSSLTVLTGLFTLLTNRDLLSPAKLYLLCFSLFFVGALSSSETDLWLLVSLVLLVGIGIAALEAAGPTRLPRPIAQPAAGAERSWTALWIWMASVPAVAAQVYIVQRFGGIQGYINVIGDRVIETRGLGPVKTVVATIGVLNLSYFAIGLTRARSRFWWACYALHLMIVLAIGFLSGSRGSTLTVFVMQLYIFHYVRRRVKLVHALMMAALLLGAAIAMGIMREGVRLDDAGLLTTGFDSSSDSGASLSTFYLGVQPLKLLVNSDDLHLAHGETLISLVTNVIPRSWWPEKPDTGGVFFTKMYTGNAWDGASNLTPTFLGEWIMNFGWAAGIVCFVAVSALMMYLLARYYRRTVARLAYPMDARAAMDVLIYVFVLWGVVGLMVGEVTNTIQTLLTSQVVPAMLIRMLLTTRRRLRRERPFSPAVAGAH